ncbi:NupC/NupG family nucleoside CNT transporter [Terribacillus saccharophilus]|uniref:Concentrative nucleoside transporter, CNT family n=1 Tax=Terribacillus saccharophilus TaxID=361277 RepID=A0A075LKN8_9BACI|nr:MULTISPECIES: nucleoside transporter C-terminal domain-containing protein [Terribacillus]AIF66507.1 pyrimidine nucleoside transporter NupC [Terribacillus goriensis]MEC0283294.1 nucleoside transporter C-terminal domain-containing protein [Terribacillus saccharophilus]MEC0290250.1 nucleoside transporter C-terminal domain-containing protein [Terribacillus saccharophilus]SEM68036.1 concentrative nucleoside transporter, CNT family [Terribacillus saccharophilus]
MSIIIGVLGILVLVAVAWAMSNDKKNINYRAVGIMLVVQLILAWFLLNTSIGRTIIKKIVDVFTKVLSFGHEGIAFILGDLSTKGYFFFDVLLMIIFVSALLSILTYTRILSFAIKYIGGFVSKITGLPKVESFVAVNSMIFGNTTAILSVKSQIHKLSPNRLFIVASSSLVAVSCSTLGAYLQLIPAEYVLVALPLNVFSGLILSSIVAPVTKEEDFEIDVKEMNNEKSFFEAIGNGTILGGKTALIVGAMLLTYMALLAMVNYILDGIVGMTFQELIGYVFAPVAFIMGIPTSEILNAGSVMGTKVAANEFVAITDFVKILPDMSTKTVGIVSAYLISFANFSSIGMILGTVQAIDQKQASLLAKVGFKVLLVATMGSILTGTIVGLFL